MLGKIDSNSRENGYDGGYHQIYHYKNSTIIYACLTRTRNTPLKRLISITEVAPRGNRSDLLDKLREECPELRRTKKGLQSGCQTGATIQFFLG